MKKLKNLKHKKLLFYISFAILIILYFFIALPPINFQSVHFVIYFSIIIGYVISLLLVCFKDKILMAFQRKGKLTYNSFYFDSKGKLKKKIKNIQEKFDDKSLITKGFAYVIGLTLIFSIIMGIAGSKLFSAKAYANQLNIEVKNNEDFNETFAFGDSELLLPEIDKEIAFKYAQAKLSTYGAQYNIDIENFTILNVKRNGKNELIRVTPLEYSGFFVAMNRYNKGTIGYIEVNVVSKETKLVEVEGGMKYMPSSILFKDLDFHIRMNYPQVMYKDKFFEVDDDGNPYWVIPTYKNEIALFNGNMPSDVILCNPVDGTIRKYKIGEEPEWVDRVVLDTIVQFQATNALKYKNGFLNATIGQKKDVFQVSDGYNYFIKDGHTYYVSCVTSPNENDQTSTGFITIDLKTKEAAQYYIPGITEMRAREIAMQHEDVKAQQLNATWPILINYKNVPTYFLVLKNDVQVRKIVLLNVEDGSIIAMGGTLQEAQTAYEEMLSSKGEIKEEVKEITGVVVDIETINNIRYIKLDDLTSTIIYKIDLSKIENHDSIFLNINDIVKITYVEKEFFNEVNKIEKINS